MCCEKHSVPFMNATCVCGSDLKSVEATKVFPEACGPDTKTASDWAAALASSMLILERYLMSIATYLFSEKHERIIPNLRASGLPLVLRQALLPFLYHRLNRVVLVRGLAHNPHERYLPSNNSTRLEMGKDCRKC